MKRISSGIITRTEAAAKSPQSGVLDSIDPIKE